MEVHSQQTAAGHFYPRITTQLVHLPAMSSDDKRWQIRPADIGDAGRRQRRRLEHGPPPSKLEGGLDHVPEGLEGVAQLVLHPEQERHLVDLPHGRQHDDGAEEQVGDHVLPLDLAQVLGDVSELHHLLLLLLLLLLALFAFPACRLLMIQVGRAWLQDV